MEIEFDPTKNALNKQKHGISFERALELDTAIVVSDGRFDEKRFRAYGKIDGVNYCLAYTVRGNKIRCISFRRARAKEMRRYVPQAK